jgi:1-acyl-sn-glycerol-3-phosphate acyltransferase
MEHDLAPLRPQVYTDPRPASYFERFHAYARTHEPGWVWTVNRIVFTPIALLGFRLSAVGAEQVPAQGPAILAPNHFSTMDHWLIAFFLRRRLRFMAKSQLFRGPAPEWFLSRAGVFPVRRGQNDEEALRTARVLLEQGSLVVIYIEGGRSRTGSLGDRARPGVGRLALETGAPVVPVAVQGSERARNWRRLEVPKVTVGYGEPLRYAAEPEADRERQQQVANEVHAVVRTLHGKLSRSAGR